MSDPISKKSAFSPLKRAFAISVAVLGLEHSEHNQANMYMISYHTELTDITLGSKFNIY